ncbi:MAG: uridine kinase [Pseudomonadota bacterium]
MSDGSKSPPTPYVVAIAGGSGSGKSTLAEALAAEIGEARAVLFREDAYYWPIDHYGPAETDAQRQAVIARIDYDTPASKDSEHMARDLAALKAGRAIDQPVYDYDRHDRANETRSIPPADLIIVEGIHALSVAETKPLIDLSVYVDTPDDLRLARRLRRDVTERGRTVESVLAQYLGTVRAAHYRDTHPAKFRADLVIADEGLPAYGDVAPSPEAIARMMSPILDRLRLAGVL